MKNNKAAQETDRKAEKNALTLKYDGHNMKVAIAQDAP
jgi:hypothetical protein